MARRGRRRRSGAERKKQLLSSPQSTQEAAPSALQHDEHYVEKSEPVGASKHRDDVAVPPLEVPVPSGLQGLAEGRQMSNATGSNLPRKRGWGMPRSACQLGASQPIDVHQTRVEVVSGLPCVRGFKQGRQKPNSAGHGMSSNGLGSPRSLQHVNAHCPVDTYQQRSEASLSPTEVSRPLGLENCIHGKQELSGAGTSMILRRGRGRPWSAQHSEVSRTAIQGHRSLNKSVDFLSTKRGCGKPGSSQLVRSPRPDQLHQSTAEANSPPPVMETCSSEAETLNKGKQPVNGGGFSSFPVPSTNTGSQILQETQHSSLQHLKTQVGSSLQRAGMQKCHCGDGINLPTYGSSASSFEEDPSEEEDPEEEEEDTVEEESLSSTEFWLSMERGQVRHPTEPHVESTPQVYQPSQGHSSHVKKVVSGLLASQAPIQEQQVDVRAASSLLGKRGRGRTRNVGLEKKQRSGEALNIVIPPVLRRAVGDDASLLINEAGITCRKYAPLQVRKWKDIDSGIKSKMWVHLKETFNLPDDARKAMMEQLNRMYRDWRHRLNVHYRKFQKDEERLQNCPGTVSQEDWKWLVAYYGSEQFQNISAKNRGNRARQTLRSATGTKSIARCAYELRDPNTGELPDACRLWRATHQKSDGTWIDQQSEEIMKQLEEVAQKHQQSGAVPLSLVEHLSSVMGTSLGYVRGLGVGPKLHTGTFGEQDNMQERQNSQSQIEDARKRAEKLEQEVKELKTQLAKTQERMQVQVATEVTHRMASFFEQMTRQMWNLTVPQASPSTPTTNENGAQPK